MVSAVGKVVKCQCQACSRVQSNYSIKGMGHWVRPYTVGLLTIDLTAFQSHIPRIATTVYSTVWLDGRFPVLSQNLVERRYLQYGINMSPLNDMIAAHYYFEPYVSVSIKQTHGIAISCRHQNIKGIRCRERFSCS